MNIEDIKDKALPSDTEGKKKKFVEPTATLIRFDSLEESESFFSCDKMPPCIGMVKRKEQIN